MSNAPEKSPAEAAPPPGLFVQTRGLWRALSPIRRAGIALAVLGTLFGSSYMACSGKEMTYETLYAGLENDDAGAIVEELKAMQIPFELGANGASVAVPAQKVHEARLAIANKGLPQGGGVGFELFDEQSFGTTRFVEKINYRRAMQGELSRTIAAIEVVENARVHVAMPDRSLFTSQDDPPSASVALRMRPGRVMTQAQVRGIVHLVSSSVEGLAADRVVVVDDTGKVLSAGEGDTVRVDAQREMEKTLENRVRSMIEKVVGPGHVAVTVTADMDYKQIEKTEELFDKDNVAVRSEARTEERIGGGAGGEAVGGVAGARGNLPGTAGPNAAGADPNTRRLSETRNYEVNRVVQRTVNPKATLRKLHVAVLVDYKTPRQPAPSPEPAAEGEGEGEGEAAAGEGAPAEGEAPAAATPETGAGEATAAAGEAGETPAQGEGAGDGEGAPTEAEAAVAVVDPIPRTADELAQIEAIAREAAGLDPNRGDRIEVRTVPFAIGPEVPEAPPAEPVPLWKQPHVVIMGAAGAMVLVGIVLALVMGRGKKSDKALAAPRPDLLPLPATLADVERVMRPGEGADGNALDAPLDADDQLARLRLMGDSPRNVYDRVVEAVREDVESAARVVSTWLHQDEPSAAPAAGEEA